MGSLYDEICSYENIKWSFDFLRKKNRRSGPDGIKWEDILENKRTYLNNLVYELNSKIYMPNPDMIMKKPYYPGSDKILYYVEMNIREKIVEYAIKRHLYPLFEGIFLDFSCAYRKGKGEKCVTQLIRNYILLGKNWFISLDIKSFFKSIDQVILVQLLSELITDNDVIELLKKCLGLNESLGIPVGHVLSPLISNFYLYKIDNELYKNKIPTIRYADNYCFASSDKNDLLYSEKVLETLLSEYGLELNTNKTKIVCNPCDYTELII